jgi:hypothetical protein
VCVHGNYKYVNIINKNQNKKVIPVDACIADEIQVLNNKGVITLGCCCGHGEAGQIAEWTNGYGTWKSYNLPPHTLICQKSVSLARDLGYSPFPYYYANGEKNVVWQMQLKTGCVTYSDCENWEKRE